MVAALRIALILAAGALALAPRGAQAQPAKEYQVKAAFLFHFVQFVEWPPAAFPSADAPICIGILGEDPFGPILEETVRGESVRNRKVVVQRSRRVEDLTDCHLLFISRSEAERLARILGDLDSRAVLTVSELDGFAQHGGLIQLYLAGQKVRFEINASAARRKGLRISSELLRLGKIVGAEGAGENR
jgi:hypothetical protein